MTSAALRAAPQAAITPPIATPATRPSTVILSPPQAGSPQRKPRGVVGSSVRADMTPQAAVEQVLRGFEEFKAANDAKLTGKADDGKVERIAADIAAMQVTLDAQAARAAADKLGVGGRQIDDPDYTTKFSAYFREGLDEQGIKSAQRQGIRAAMTEGSSANGGYTTPLEWDRTITARLKLISPIRAHAKVQPISTVGFSKVFNDRTIGSGWVGETAARPATATPGLTSLPYVVGEIYAMPNASQDLLDDSLINIEEWLAGEVDTEFARQEGIAFISGSGTNMPTGILTYITGAANAAVHPFGDIKVRKSAAAAAYTSDAVIQIVYDVPAAYQSNAKFFGNRTSLSSLMLLKNGQGNYLWQPSYQAGQPSTLFGQPFIDVPDMPNVAAGATPLLYGDMATAYLVIDRMGIRVLRDPYSNKPFVQFYTTKRVGGGLLNPDAIKVMLIGT